jgi:hypothetical protein
MEGRKEIVTSDVVTSYIFIVMFQITFFYYVERTLKYLISF